MSCLPEHLEGRRYYEPTERGIEGRIKDALEKARAIRRSSNTEDTEKTEDTERTEDKRS